MNPPILFVGVKYWSVHRQMSVEGGFQGRTNKLVDSCYSTWVVRCFLSFYSIIISLVVAGFLFLFFSFFLFRGMDGFVSSLVSIFSLDIDFFIFSLCLNQREQCSIF